MGYRPTDWSALDLYGDPVPGSPDDIRTGSRKLATVANSITQQATRLRTLSTKEGWDSESGDEFHSDAGKLADAIEKAHGRYKGVSDALSTYAGELETVQATADRYLADAKKAEEDSSTAKATTLPDKDDPGYQNAKDKQDDAADDASGALARARANIQSLIGIGGEYAKANKKAADAIRGASDDDLKDAWYEGFRDLVHSLKGWLDTIKDILAIVGTILAIAILILSLVIPGANIISALLLTALILSVVNLAIVGAQAVAGDATAADVGFAALNVVLSAIGVKFPPLGPGASAGKSLEGLITGHFSDKLAYSLAHNFGWRVGQNGGSYSRGYQFFQSVMKSLGESRGTVNSANVLFGGDIGKLVAIRLSGNSARATEFLIPAVISSTPFVLNTLRERVKQISEIPETVTEIKDLVFNFNGVLEENSKVSVGSL